MALEDILEAIRREADGAAARLLEGAESEARQILLRAEEEAEREETRLASTVDDRIRLERGRILSHSHLEAARAGRAAREEVYQMILDAVTRRLAKVRSSPRYQGLLGLLLDTTLADLPNPTAVRADPEDVELIEELLTGRRPDIPVENEQLPLGGVIAVSVGRSVDNSLASRLRRADPQLRLLAGQAIGALRGGVG